MCAKTSQKKLFNLQKTHKTLSQKVISSVTKNFVYMLQQNSGNPDKIAIGLKAVVEHMYGNHLLPRVVLFLERS